VNRELLLTTHGSRIHSERRGRLRGRLCHLTVVDAMAAEGIDLIHAVEPAAAIIARVIAEAEAALAQSFV
jgi:hypothetical protein